MLLIIKKGICGGILMISHRYGKANNKYMGEKFDSEKRSSCIELGNVTKITNTWIYMDD